LAASPLGASPFGASPFGASPLVTSPMGKQGLGSLDDGGHSGACLRTFHFYLVVPLSLDDYAELGDADLICSEQPLEPMPSTALVSLCRSRASSSWQAYMEDRISDWGCPTPEGLRCCRALRRAQGLSRPGMSPPCRWRRNFPAGGVWLKCMDAFMLASSIEEAPKKSLLAQAPMVGDPVQAYRELLIASGCDVPPVPAAKDSAAKACYAKLLHTYESSEVQELLDILQDAAGGEAHLEFSRTVVAGPIGTSCVVA